MQRPPGRGVPVPGRQLAKARETAGHSRVAWLPAQGYAASHPAASGVPATPLSAVEQSQYHWPGSLEPLSYQSWGNRAGGAATASPGANPTGSLGS